MGNTNVTPSSRPTIEKLSVENVEIPKNKTCIASSPDKSPDDSTGNIVNDQEVNIGQEQITDTSRGACKILDTPDIQTFKEEEETTDIGFPEKFQTSTNEIKFTTGQFAFNLDTYEKDYSFLGSVLDEEYLLGQGEEKWLNSLVNKVDHFDRNNCKYSLDNADMNGYSYEDNKMRSQGNGQTYLENNRMDHFLSRSDIFNMDLSHSQSYQMSPNLCSPLVKFLKNEIDFYTDFSQRNKGKRYT